MGKRRSRKATRRSSKTTASRKPVKKKAAKKKAAPKRAAKKTAKKKTAKKKTVAKKLARKAAPEKAARKKAAPEKAARKKAAPKKAAPKKAAPKKAKGKKATRKTATRKKATSKKTTPKKAAPTKAVPETAAEKAPPRKAARSAASSKAAKNAAPKKAAKKSAKKSVAPEKAAPKKRSAADGRRLLEELIALVENANDATAEEILGGGALERLLRAVLPQKKRASHSVHEHLAVHKRRASLMAQVRHAVDQTYAYTEGKSFVSPTKVQWFYDGLTFLEGGAPFEGVVGLFREGEVRYGLGLDDAAPGTSLGPAETDFVSVAHAKRSFKAARGDRDAALAEMGELASNGGADASTWVDVLGRHPWVLGAQHVSVRTRESTGADDELPSLFAKRATDGCWDVVVVEPPSTPVVGKNGKLLSAFHGVWHRAERQLSFVERQADYLNREMRLKIRNPRCFLIVGNRLSHEERETVRREKESHAANVRLLTYDDLRSLAGGTSRFFSDRV